MGVFTWLTALLRGLGALVLPVFGKARRSTLLWRIVLWTVHFLIVALILWGLYYLNQAWHIATLIPGHKELAPFWLPILFLMFYVLAWLGWWLWKLLVTDDSYTEFPDITEAWEEAMEALARARIDPREVPLFLIVGRTEGSMQGLFKASKLGMEVRQTPAADGAPLHVFATRDAVYVTCEGASLLGKHSGGLSGRGDADYAARPTGDSNDIDKTNRPDQMGGPLKEIAQIVARATRERREQTAEEQRRIRLLMRQDRARPTIVRNAAEVELLGARFEHLCRLLVRDRWPYCPVNGMMVLLPFAATDTDQDALDAAAACQRDLSVARRVLQVNCPTLAVVCDLETAPGFAAFLQPFTEKERLQRIGQRCPMAPALETRGRAGDAEARAAMLESLAEWVCGAVPPGWVYKHFQLEPADATAGQAADVALSNTDPIQASRTGRGPRRGRADAFRSNAEQFLFMHQLRQRQRRLGRLLSRGLILEDEDPILFAGCYLAATGSDARGEQAFVAGAFDRLAKEENNVSWTTLARSEESSHLRWSLLGQLGAAVLFLGVVALWLYIWFNWKQLGPHGS